MKLGFRSFLFLGLGLTAAATYFLGVLPRQRASAGLEARAKEAGHPIVNIVLAGRAAAAGDLLLPANLQAI